MGVAVWPFTLLGLAFAHPASAQVPRIFAPGVISSSAHDSAPAFGQDGRSVFFTRSTDAASMILFSKLSKSGWSTPEVAPFSGRWIDMEPAFSPDGTYLIFVSNRPINAGSPPIDGNAAGKLQKGRGGNLWRVDRVGAGWGRPRRLPGTVNNGGSVYAPSIAADGTLFFMSPSPTTGRFQLFYSTKSSLGYDRPIPLPFSDGSSTDVDPAVAPDQSYIVFGSGRKAGKDIDLYVSFNGRGGWTDPVYLGDAVNSRTSDAEPRLSADAKLLYFSSERVLVEETPIPTRRIDDVRKSMTGWNNGLYNIWVVGTASVLSLRPVTPALSR